VRCEVIDPESEVQKNVVESRVVDLELVKRSGEKFLQWDRGRNPKSLSR